MMFADLEKLGFATLEDYQRFHGLPVTGKMDRLTERSFAEPRYCGLPDQLNFGRRQTCKWNSLDLTCSWQGQLQGISSDEAFAAITRAWSAWHRVCGIRVTMTSNYKTADIQVYPRRIDGASSVLARAELPCGSQDSTKTVEVDQDEPWVTVLDPPRSRVSLVLTLIHEFGHSLGLSHGPSGSIMQSIYSASVKEPQDWDVAQAQMRYGQPRPTVKPPTEPPTVPDDGEYIIIPGHRIPKSWLESRNHG